MKKFLIIAVSTVLSVNCFACDICGCGAGGGYTGLLPGFRKKFISLRYLQNGLVSHLGPDGNYTYLTTHENFRVAELWGAANIGEHFRIAGFVPMNFLERKNGTGRFSRSGPGDITVIAYYQLLNTQKTTQGNNLLVQSLWVGAGIKAPTGKYNPEEKSIRENTQNTFQSGTGSLDLSLNTMYDIRLQDAGLNINTSYKINTRNKYDYSYGDKFMINALAYYKFRIGKSFSVVPNTGVLYERSAKDEKVKDVEVWETGGYSLMGTVGMELSFGRVGAGVNYQTPLSQDLGEGKVLAKDRGMAYVSLSF